MSIKKILIYLLIFFLFFSFVNFNFLYSQGSGTSSTSSDEEVIRTIDEEEWEPSQLDWRFFYDQIRPAANARCFVGNTALEKITNCIDQVAKALQFLAIIIFILSLTVIAGFLVFSPVKKEYLDTAKKTLIWTIIGFIILFIIRDIMLLIRNLAGQ